MATVKGRERRAGDLQHGDHAEETRLGALRWRLRFGKYWTVHVPEGKKMSKGYDWSHHGVILGPDRLRLFYYDNIFDYEEGPHSEQPQGRIPDLLDAIILGGNFYTL